MENGDRVSSSRRSRRWMDVLVSLNGMLIKGLGCGLRCKVHLQLQNVPLEMSVISAQTRQLCWPSDAPLQPFIHRLVGLGFATYRRQKQFNFHKHTARLQNSHFVSEYNGNRQGKNKYAATTLKTVSRFSVADAYSIYLYLLCILYGASLSFSSLSFSPSI